MNTIQNQNVRNIALFRAVFNWVSKVIRHCFGFALLRSMIGLKNSRHLLNQSDANPKPIATWSHAFSRAWRRLRAFASSSHWFIVLFTFLMIDDCNCFGFGVTTLNWKPLFKGFLFNVVQANQKTVTLRALYSFAGKTLFSKELKVTTWETVLAEEHPKIVW